MEDEWLKTCYRSRLTAPKLKHISQQETLIDTPHFQEFLRQTLPVFRRADNIAHLRCAMYALLGADDGDIETQFLRLFTALETLVTYGSETAAFGPILDGGQWLKFRKELKNFIKGTPPFDANADLRGLILEKVGELNRVSFASSFHKFAATLATEGLGLSDLWPVTGKEDGVSLSSIRNRLVHGDFHDERLSQPIFLASYHLRWCVERMILAILKWPVEKSLVGNFLRNLVPYNEWKLAQGLFPQS